VLANGGNIITQIKQLYAKVSKNVSVLALQPKNQRYRSRLGLEKYWRISVSSRTENQTSRCLRSRLHPCILLVLNLNANNMHILWITIYVVIGQPCNSYWNTPWRGHSRFMHTSRREKFVTGWGGPPEMAFLAWHSFWASPETLGDTFCSLRKGHQLAIFPNIWIVEVLP